MLAISAENQAALAAGGESGIDVRDFVTFTVRDRDTGEPVVDGMWSDIGNITAPVINPLTNIQEDRLFYGAYGLVEIDAIPRVHNISVQEITIKLSQISDRVESLIRTNDAKFGRVEIFRGLYVIGTRTLAAAAFPRFVGFIDNVEVITPEEAGEGGEGGEGYVQVTCKSHTVEMLRGNSETRSNTSQKLRDPTDNFFQDADVVGNWEIFWGKKNGKVKPKPKEIVLPPWTPKIKI